MLTSRNSVRRDFKLLKKQIRSGEKQDALNTLEKLIKVYGHEDILSFAIEISDKTQGNLLYFAALYDSDLVISRLIDCGAPIDNGSTSTDPMLDKVSPLMAACACENRRSVEIILQHHPNLLHKNSKGDNILAFPNSIEILNIIIAEAIKKNCIYPLILMKNNDGDNIYSYYCQVNRPKHLAELIKIENYQAWIDVNSLLHNARIAYWLYPTQSKEFNEICLALRSVKKYPPVVEFKKDSSVTSFSQAYLKLFGKYECFESLDNKQINIRRAIAKFYSLLASPKECVKYLQFLNNEFARYFREKHGKDFPRLDPHSYEFQIIDGIYYPIPKEDYVKLDKHHALQEYLMALFNQYGIAKRAYKWIGFIPYKTSADMITNGDMLTESRLGTGLFHNKISHMIQRAILIFAIEEGVIQLENMTLNDIFNALMTINEHSYPHNSKSKIWMPVLDTRFLTGVSFTDPHRLGSVIMRDGKEMEINALSDALIDTFCNGITHLLQVYQRHHADLELKTFVDYINDHQLAYFFSTFVTKHEIKSEIKKGSISDKDKGRSFKGNLYACVPKNYSPNKDFEPRRFTK